MSRRSTPPQRRPVLPPWSRAECPECADPVEYVVLDVEKAVEGRRVAVVRAVDHRGTIAARMIGNQLHGYTINRWHPQKEGFIRLRLHSEVCEFAVPKTEQRELF